MVITSVSRKQAIMMICSACDRRSINIKCPGHRECEFANDIMDTWNSQRMVDDTPADTAMTIVKEFKEGLLHTEGYKISDVLDKLEAVIEGFEYVHEEMSGKKEKEERGSNKYV